MSPFHFSRLHKEPLLLTPGPLTTALATRKAMLRDIGSRDDSFTAINQSIRQRLLIIAGAEKGYTCVPLQGCGTFAVEAMLSTLVPRTKSCVLVLVNGIYGRRMAEILDRIGRPYLTYETEETSPPNTVDINQILIARKDITHVAMVHCETTTGLLNPVETIARIVVSQKRSLLLDSISAFGALPIDVRTIPFTAMAVSANKCLESVPGLSFVLCNQDTLKKMEHNAHTLSLDLYAQWSAMEKDGQWRFTPPTHAVLALEQALDIFDSSGGQLARLTRYRKNCSTLMEGFQQLGFTPLLPTTLQAPIIITFLLPPISLPNFCFSEFYAHMREHGYILYPGRLTKMNSFRVGCIGNINQTDIIATIETARYVLYRMGAKVPTIS